MTDPLPGLSEALPGMTEQQPEAQPPKRFPWILLATLAGVALVFGIAAVTRSNSSADADSDTEKPAKVASASLESTALPSADQNILPEDVRQFIWDVEHVAFEMEAKVLPQIKQALTEPNLALLSRYLGTGFRGTVPADEWSQISAGDDWSVSRQEIDSDSKQVSALQFANRMASYRQMFDPSDQCDCGASIGLVRLGPVDKSSLEGPWYGQWRIRLWGERDGHPLEMQMTLKVDLDPLRADVESQEQFIRSAELVKVEKREATNANRFV